MDIKFVFTSIFAFATLLPLSTSEPVEDKQALLDFIAKITHSRYLNWNQNTSVCNHWTGVTCNHDESRITAVRLPAFGLKGLVPSNTLSRLSELQILSLRSNALTGPFPPDLLRIQKLTGIYLQDNNFIGPLPSDFGVWTNLSVLILSNNGFNGIIPSSISNLHYLQVLNLASNAFFGEIPNLDIRGLTSLDLSGNNLTGPVPKSLLRFPHSSFSGNNVSFDYYSFAPAPAPSPSVMIEKQNSSKISEPAILGIVIGSCSLAFIAIAILLIIMNKTEKRDDLSTATTNTAATTAYTYDKKSKNIKTDSDQHQNDPNSTLAFFEGCNSAFDLEDLLRASAEVLGKGTFGTTYKAALEDANALFAVKRLKSVGAGRKEFENQMEIVGNIRHENIVPLRAYYYSKDEKLLIYDYYDGGSLSSILHDETKKNALNWEMRLRIAVNAAKGIAHIHSINNDKKLVHGNIKASNILLDSQMQVRLSDLGLHSLMTPIVSTQVTRTLGYRAPELVSNAKKSASQASDVYSFGVLILEVLTGKSPTQNYGTKEGFNLVRWVQSVVREEWTGEVFDTDLLKYRNIEEDMVEMLQLGMSCVAKAAEQRPEIGDVVKVLEGIRGNDVRSSYTSASDGIRSLGSSPALS